MPTETTGNSNALPDWLGNALGFSIYAYVVTVLTTFNDSSFLLNGPAVRLNIGVYVPAGSISLPAVGRSISLVDFFLFVPLLILATHLLLLQFLRHRLLAGRLAPVQSLALVSLVGFAGPAVLLAVQGTYAPFATIRPTGSGPAEAMLLIHCIVIAASALATAIALFRPGRAGAPRQLPSRELRYVLLAFIALWFAYAAYRLVSLPAVATLLIGAGEQQASAHSVATGLAPGIGALLLSPLIIAALTGRSLPNCQKWSIPMTFRVFLLAIAAASFSNLAAARSVDLTGVMPVKSPPSEPILLAYLERAGQRQELNAWLRAHNDFGSSVDLTAYRLDSARFNNAILLKTNGTSDQQFRLRRNGRLSVGMTLRSG